MKKQTSESDNAPLSKQTGLGMADPLFHVISYLSLQSVLVSTVMLLKDLKWCTLYTRFGKNTVAVDTEKTAKYMGNRRNLNHQEGSSLITNQYQYYNKKPYEEWHPFKNSVIVCFRCQLTTVYVLDSLHDMFPHNFYLVPMTSQYQSLNEMCSNAGQRL